MMNLSFPRPVGFNEAACRGNAVASYDARSGFDSDSMGTTARDALNNNRGGDVPAAVVSRYLWYGRISGCDDGKILAGEMYL